MFIIDDPIYSRARSKRVELLAKTYDHVKKKYVHGFRMLTLGWSDGISFIPLAFSLNACNGPST
ncbi:MAG: transposase [Firmicutes bacterium]|nr:transposase [Bacillota bacterium]